MKIPETSANVGAYYGNEENGQWQPNGVIIDSGVGGGVVGSGDAGVHRPPVYPLHIPRGHIPGYVMAGAFYPPAPYGVAPPPAPAPDDFEDYMWMENEEEFDKQVMQQLEEEALMEQCIEAMLEDEQREQRSRAGKDQPTTSNGNPLSLEETVSRSTLNPLAAEFVPTGASSSARVPRPDPPPEEKAESPEAAPPRAEDSAPAPPEPDHAPDTDNKTEESPSPVEPPTASVADVSADKRPKDLKSKDTKPKDAKKPPAKVETKPKAKPLAVKSEPKVETKPKKKDAPKPARSDAALHDTQPVDVPKPQPPTPTEETSPSPPGLKPINYAAAARANKPKAKPAVAAPASAPAAPAVATKDKKPAEKPAKQKPTTDKPVQRKNSAK